MFESGTFLCVFPALFVYFDQTFLFPPPVLERGGERDAMLSNKSPGSRNMVSTILPMTTVLGLAGEHWNHQQVQVELTDPLLSTKRETEPRSGGRRRQ